MTEQKTPLHRIAELMDELYPDPAPPKEYRENFWLYETLTDAELDHLRHELSDVEVKS